MAFNVFHFIVALGASRVDAFKPGTHQMALRRANCATEMAFAGHRGYSSEAPENTVAAVDRACSQGLQGVEFDIQLSSDGQIFLLHDDELERTAKPECPVMLCGNGAFTQQQYQDNLKKNVNTLSYTSFIQHVDVGDGQTPPLLVDVMNRIPNDHFVLCELKGGDRAMAAAVLLLLKNNPTWSGKLRFIGFDFDLMKEIKAGLIGSINATKVYLLSQTREYDHPVDVLKPISNEDRNAAAEVAEGVMENAEREGFAGVDFEANTQVVTKDVIEKAREHNLDIGVWVWSQLENSDSGENAKRFKKLCVDFFTSDVPSSVRALVRNEE